jgi:hypothetical protein
MFADSPLFWRDRFQASGIHLLISLVIAALAALLVLGVWYPYPYREISGGRELFFLIVTVDVILGPLITLAIFNRKKSWPLLRRDLLVISAIQFAALIYGLHTVYVTRPVHLVFEYYRFNVVHAIDVPQEMMGKVPSEVDAMPALGPTLLSLRPFKNSKEKADATFDDLAGLKLSVRPDFWQPYEKAKAQIQAEAKPVAELIARFPADASTIRAVAQDAGRRAEDLVYLPMIGRKLFWTVLLDPATTQVVTFVPLDSF